MGKTDKIIVIAPNNYQRNPRETPEKLQTIAIGQDYLGSPWTISPEIAVCPQLPATLKQ
jgi:hypothetical protein